MLLSLFWTHLHQILCKSLQIATENITVPTCRKELGNRFHPWSWKSKKISHSTNNHALRPRDEEFSKSLISHSNNFGRRPKVVFALSLSECTKPKHTYIQAQRHCKKKNFHDVMLHFVLSQFCLVSCRKVAPCHNAWSLGTFSME